MSKKDDIGGAALTEGWRYSLKYGERTIKLSADRLTVGRSRRCDVSVNDPSVSRKHAFLTLDTGKVLLQDLGSSNGTFINEERVTAEGELFDGDSLRLGDAELRVRIRSHTDSADQESAVKAPPVPLPPDDVLPATSTVAGSSVAVLAPALGELGSGSEQETGDEEDEDPPPAPTLKLPLLSGPAPVEETPVEETPLEEIPLEEIPLEEIPLEETPVEETPVEETPAPPKPALAPPPTAAKRAPLRPPPDPLDLDDSLALVAAAPVASEDRPSGGGEGGQRYLEGLRSTAVGSLAPGPPAPLKTPDSLEEARSPEIQPPRQKTPVPEAQVPGAWQSSLSREGSTEIYVAPTGELRAAGFWLRAAAQLIDALWVSALAWVAFRFGNRLGAAFTLVASTLVPWLGWGLWGTTPGKGLLGLYVVTVDGSRLGLLRSALRLFGFALSIGSMGFGFLMALFTDDHRTLHDRIARTTVERRMF